jgi:hypothetical protein
MKPTANGNLGTTHPERDKYQISRHVFFFKFLTITYTVNCEIHVFASDLFSQIQVPLPITKLKSAKT